MRLSDGDAIAGFEVIERVQLRLQLIARRRFDEINLVFLPLFRAQRNELFAVGRPKNALGIAIFGVAVLTQGRLFAGRFLAEIQIVVLDENRPLPVRRSGAQALAAAAPRRILLGFLSRRWSE